MAGYLGTLIEKDEATRVKVFPRFRAVSVGEVTGVTQRKRAISRRYHLATIRDPMTPAKNAKRRALRKIGWYSTPAKLLRFALRVMR